MGEVCCVEFQTPGIGEVVEVGRDDAFLGGLVDETVGEVQAGFIETHAWGHQGGQEIGEGNDVVSHVFEGQCDREFLYDIYPS